MFKTHFYSFLLTIRNILYIALYSEIEDLHNAASKNKTQYFIVKRQFLDCTFTIDISAKTFACYVCLKCTSHDQRLNILCTKCGTAILSYIIGWVSSWCRRGSLESIVWSFCATRCCWWHTLSTFQRIMGCRGQTLNEVWFLVPHRVEISIRRVHSDWRTRAQGGKTPLSTVQSQLCCQKLKGNSLYVSRKGFCRNGCIKNSRKLSSYVSSLVLKTGVQKLFVSRSSMIFSQWTLFWKTNDNSVKNKKCYTHIQKNAVQLKYSCTTSVSIQWIPLGSKEVLQNTKEMQRWYHTWRSAATAVHSSSLCFVYMCGQGPYFSSRSEGNHGLFQEKQNQQFTKSCPVLAWF